MKKQHLACMGLLCAILWMGCSGKKSHFELSAADSTSTITTLDTTLQAAKLVKTADMRFKVRNVKNSSEAISVLTAKYKGMVMHHDMRSDIGQSATMPQSNDSVVLISSYNTNAEMTVKIPSVQVDEFLNDVGKIAVYINNRSMDIKDKSLDYLSTQMKLISRKDMIAQQKQGVIKIKNPADVMSLKDDLIDQQIDNKRIDEAIRYSTVALSFYQSNTISREVIMNDDPSNFKSPFFTRLGYSFANGWSIFTDALIGIANLWMFILASISGWFLYKYYRKRSAIATV